MFLMCTEKSLLYILSFSMMIFLSFLNILCWIILENSIVTFIYNVIFHYNSSTWHWTLFFHYTMSWHALTCNYIRNFDDFIIYCDWKCPILLIDSIIYCNWMIKVWHLNKFTLCTTTKESKSFSPWKSSKRTKKNPK